MEDYKVQIINEYWLKQAGKKASCPKCKIGTLNFYACLICDNCGKSPVRWLIFKT